jgi:peptidyl-prolyl cis-trans isomerase SurA
MKGRKMNSIRKGFYLTIAIMIAINTYAFPENLDPSVATIKLNKTEVIYKSEFVERIQQLQPLAGRPLTDAEKKSVLDSMITEKIILLDADRKRISVSQTEINSTLEAYKQNLSAANNLGRTITDDELKQSLLQNKTTWEQFMASLKMQVIISKIVSSQFKGTNAIVSNDDIIDYYDSNRNQFISQEYVSFKEIFIPKSGLNKEQSESYLNILEQIQRQIESGSSFDKFTNINGNDGTNQKIGGIQFQQWNRNDTTKRTEYGQILFLTLFKMKEGEVSKVIQSNVGFHIVFVIEHSPFKVMGLDDKVPPQNLYTVKATISSYLEKLNSQKALQQTQNEIVNSLKQEAQITIFEQNM